MNSRANRPELVEAVKALAPTARLADIDMMIDTILGVIKDWMIDSLSAIEQGSESILVIEGFGTFTVKVSPRYGAIVRFKLGEAITAARHERNQALNHPMLLRPQYLRHQLHSKAPNLPITS